ncbi:MFS transporter (plasmid) [Priestia megaterium]|uniref:MFS transporter n=1 Tax=Priestia megaterium TaxID=1404 RepID=UPI003899953B
MLEKPVLMPEGKTSTNVRWRIVIWLCICALINNIDRINLSIAAPAMMEELNLSNAQIGLLGSAFAWFYAISQLPSGWLIDRFGAKKVLTLAIGWWSLATVFMGFAQGFVILIILRALLGMGEAPSLPSTAKIVASWFPKKERGLANASWDAALKVGPALFTTALIAIVSLWGWRWLFFIAGGLGLIFTLFFGLFYRSPEQHRKLSKEEYEYIKSDSVELNTEKNVKISWRKLFMVRSMWGMMLGYFCNIWVYQIFLTFMPLYIMKIHNVQFNKLGLYASIPWIGAMLGDIISGLISKKLVDRGMGAIKAKKVVIISAALLQACVVAFLPFSTNIIFTVTLMSFALAFNGAVVCHAWSLASDLAPSEMVASVTSVQNFGGFLGGAISPIVAGLLIDATDSYFLVFISAAVVGIVSAISYQFIVKRPIHHDIKTNV